jgi:hypothetical protein
MTSAQKAQIQEKSLEGSGPRIVTKETLRQLKRNRAPKHLIEAAEKAIRSNPV